MKRKSEIAIYAKTIFFKKTLTLVFLILLCALCVESFVCDQSVIQWDVKRKLEYKDFEALPPLKNEYLAETSTDIKTQITFNQEQVCYKAVTRFKKNESWFKGINPKILKHEQLHFDITEIFTRQLRKDFSILELCKNNYQTKIDSLYFSNNVELNKFQDQYDLETDHSKNDSMQKKWEAIVCSKLKEMDSYTDSVYCSQFW
jgi:hypothetical protein